MGMNIACMLYLQEKGLLTAEKNKLLDIGPQNVYHCTEEQIRTFVRQQGATVDGAVLDKETKRLEYFSTPRPEERTTLFSEIAVLANVEYHAFDVCPAPKTELLDLNFESLPERHRERYDVVLNFGTTEHIFNQWNCFTVIHDATKVGGVIYCVLPAIGSLDHGYFSYTPIFFRDLASANMYEVIDQFLAVQDLDAISKAGFDLRGEGKFLQPHSVRLTPDEDKFRCLNAHVIMRKTKSAPFRCALEVATAHSAVDAGISVRYHDGAVDHPIRAHDRVLAERDEARAQLKQARAQVQAMLESRSWRLTAALRALNAATRGQPRPR